MLLGGGGAEGGVFARGATDKITVSAEDVGDLSHVVMRLVSRNAVKQGDRALDPHRYLSLNWSFPFDGNLPHHTVDRPLMPGLWMPGVLP